MRKFEVVVETTKTYVIEIDDNQLTEEDLEGWESVFHDLDSEDDKISSLVLDYCECRARLGDTFIEGHGRVLRKGQKRPSYIDESDVCEYMKIIDCDDDGDIDTYVKELDVTE